MDEILKMVTAPPDLSGIEKALFIQPHPDDNEIGAGGLMAKLVAQGTQVFCLTVTDDHAVCPKEAWQNGRTVRQNEVFAAAEALGVTNLGFLGFEDKTEASVKEISKKIVRVIRDIKPNAVFSVDPTLSTECHSDHIKVGWAVRYAVMDAICDFYPPTEDGSRHDDVWQVEILGQYFTDAFNEIIDISEYAAKKQEAICCHQSQISPELLMLLELQAKHFGDKRGYEFGEPYKLNSFLQLHCFNLPVEHLE